MNVDILILPKGSFSHPTGTQIVDSAAIRRVIGAIKNYGRDIPVDYGHESFSSPRAEAAGWLDKSSLYETGEGLWGKIEWTKEALEKIREKKFRFLSPVLVFNPGRSDGKTLHIERLVSIGLTNHPNIPAMKPLLNQLRMEGKMDEQLAKLKSALEIPPETDDATALESALEKFKNAASDSGGLAQVKNALGLETDSSISDALSRIETMQAESPGDDGLPSREEWQTLRAELTRLQQKEVSDMVYNAITAGKLLPAQKEWALGYANSDLEGFRAFIANSRPLVEMGQLINHNIDRGEAPIDPIQEKLNRMLGISREVFDRYNQPDS